MKYTSKENIGLAAVPVHYRATELCIKVSKPFCERQETLNSSPVHSHNVSHGSPIKDNRRRELSERQST